MTLAQAKQTAKEYGFTLRHREGEYRVNVPNGTEDSAYYTNDRWDAVETGIAMARHSALMRVASAGAPIPCCGGNCSKVVL